MATTKPTLTCLFPSGDESLVGYLAAPEGNDSGTTPALIICHGFPTSEHGGANSFATFPALVDRVVSQLGWVGLAFCYRGCGGSTGDFSLRGWLDDVKAAIDFVAARGDVDTIWLMGFGTGGSLSICAAAEDDRVHGAVSLAAPADFEDWSEHPNELLEHARTTKVVSTEGFPADIAAWRSELGSIRALDCVARMGSKNLLVLHGAKDEIVPQWDARNLADAHGNADQRIIKSAAHHLRHDPRAIAIALGWLERQADAESGPDPEFA